MGYIQNYEIWHESSQGTFIMIQEEPIWRTMWGPCFGHERVIFWPFLGKGASGYNQQCKIWHKTCLGTLLRIQKEPIWRTMWGSCLGHKRAIFWPFLGKGTREYNQQFEIWHWASLGTWIEIQEEKSERQCEDHVWVGLYRVILWPFLGKGVRGYIQQCGAAWCSPGHNT